MEKTILLSWSNIFSIIRVVTFTVFFCVSTNPESYPLSWHYWHLPPPLVIIPLIDSRKKLEGVHTLGVPVTRASLQCRGSHWAAVIGSLCCNTLSSLNFFMFQMYNVHGWWRHKWPLTIFFTKSFQKKCIIKYLGLSTVREQYGMSVMTNIQYIGIHLISVKRIP